MPACLYPRASSNMLRFSAWKPASVTNWNLYPMRASSVWKRAMVASSRFFRQLKRASSCRPASCPDIARESPRQSGAPPPDPAAKFRTRSDRHRAHKRGRVRSPNRFRRECGRSLRVVRSPVRTRGRAGRCRWSAGARCPHRCEP